MRMALTSIIALLLCTSLLAGDDLESEKKAIMKTVEGAYVIGCHITGDAEAIRKGFHEDFVMFVNRDGKITKVTREQWIARIEAGKAENPDQPAPEVKHDFAVVDLTGNAAVVKIEMYKNGSHVFTDYMSLYKFQDGWKIIGKIFQTH